MKKKSIWTLVFACIAFLLCFFSWGALWGFVLSVITLIVTSVLRKNDSKSRILISSLVISIIALIANILACWVFFVVYRIVE